MQRSVFAGPPLRLRVPPSSQGGERGVSLVEIVMVIAVIGILGAMAMPAFNTLTGRGKLKGSLKEAKGALYLAKSEAVSRGAEMTVHIEPATRQFRIFRDVDRSGLFDGSDTLIRQMRLTDTTYAMAFDSGTGPSTVFFINGSASQSIYLRFTRGDEGKGVRVLASTGRLKEYDIP